MGPAVAHKKQHRHIIKQAKMSAILAFLYLFDFKFQADTAQTDGKTKA